MKRFSKKGMGTSTIVAFIIAIVVLIAVVTYAPGIIQKISVSLIASSEGQIDNALSEANAQAIELPAPEYVPEISSGTSPSSSLEGSSIAEKAVVAAKEAGMDRQGAELILKLISQESQFRHCCEVAGQNTDRTCKPTTENICPENRVLISFDGSSTGAMQLNKKVHKPWFTTDETQLCTDAKYATVCKIKKNAGCMGKTAYDLDCNIRMGIRLLQTYEAQYGDGRLFPDPKIASKCKYQRSEPVCTSQNSKMYTGWDAALRGYVGWCCDKPHYSYVENLNKKTAAVTQYKDILGGVYG